MTVLNRVDSKFDFNIGHWMITSLIWRVAVLATFRIVFYINHVSAYNFTVDIAMHGIMLAIDLMIYTLAFNVKSKIRNKCVSVLMVKDRVAYKYALWEYFNGTVIVNSALKLVIFIVAPTVAYNLMQYARFDAMDIICEAYMLGLICGFIGDMAYINLGYSAKQQS